MTIPGKVVILFDSGSGFIVDVKAYDEYAFSTDFSKIYQDKDTLEFADLKELAVLTKVLNRQC